MKLSVLHQLLGRRLRVDEFRLLLEDDLRGYLERANVTGSVMPVRVEEDDDIIVSVDDVKTLCDLFVSGQLGAEELAYVADTMQLSERVSFDEGVADRIAEMTDPEMNGPFTIKRAREILERV